MLWLVIDEPGHTLLIGLSYVARGLLSFFTVGPVDVGAWTVRAGALARVAAGAIHSDLERGFIRAEVISYEDLVKVGGLPKAREQGLLRTEGKDYRVRDGDVINVRFSV
jgi:ribosome-binding ATPase YchF (GTP1/OBG family)